MKKTGSSTGRLFRKSGRDLGEIPMREEASWWLKVAEKDMGRAELMFEVGDYEACVFWSQQVVEFSLKALMLALGFSPPKTHSLIELYERVRDVLGPLDESLLSELTPYYSASRYPNVFSGVPEVHEKTAERFLRFAKEVLMRVERLMEEGP